MGLKKPVPANLQGQVESFLTCGATLLGENHPLSAYQHMPDLFTGFQPRRLYSELLRFLLPSKAHST